jgi:integrase
LACRLIGGAGSGTVGIEEATMHTAIPLPVPCKRAPWNKGRLIGQKRPLKPKDVWAIRVRLQLQGRKRDLALFNLAIDSKLRGCDLVRLQVDDVCAGGRVRDRGTVIQKKTGRPVQFEIMEQTRASIHDWLSKVELPNGRYLFPSPTASLYSAIRSDRPCLGREFGARQFGLRHTFNAPDEGGADLQKDW